MTDEQIEAAIEAIQAMLEQRAGESAKLIEGIAKPAALSAPEAQSIEAAPKAKRRRKLNRLMMEVDTAVGPRQHRQTKRQPPSEPWSDVGLRDALAMTINPYTQDLYGREVDGWYWVLLEDGFKNCAVRYRASENERAASIADRLAETADDVPAQLMQELQDLWNDLFDYPDGQLPAEVTDEELMDSFACGYSPENATAFVLEFIRRVTGARPQ